MSLGYRIMKNLIKTKRQTKEQMLEKCDAYLGADRMSAEEYAELVAEIEAIEE